MSIISEAIEDQQFAQVVEPDRARRAFFPWVRREIAMAEAERARFASTTGPLFRKDLPDLRALFTKDLLDKAEQDFRASLRRDESLIRDFIAKHTGLVTTDPTPAGAVALVGKLAKMGIAPCFLIDPNPDKPRRFVLMRRAPQLGELPDIIASLDLPRFRP